MKAYYDNLFNELIIDNFAGGGGASIGIELATRISEMRRDGIEIDGEMISVKDRRGNTCHVMRYTLGGKDEGIL